MRTSPWSGKRTHAVLTVGDRESIADAQRGGRRPDERTGGTGHAGTIRSVALGALVVAQRGEPVHRTPRTAALTLLAALALLVDARGRVLSDAHVVFFGCPRSADGSVRHRGTDLSGEGEGDDERIEVDLGAVPADAVRVVFPVAIYDAVRRRQSFRQVRHAYVRVVERPGGRELVRFELGDEASVETAMIFAELYRAGGGWKFRAVGQGYATGLRGIADDYGVHVR